MKTVSEVATLLHKYTCHTVGAPMSSDHECNSASGGSHARQTQTSPAREVLAAPDPDAALHDRLCEAHVHWLSHASAAPGVRCPDYEAHVEAFRRENLLGRTEAQEVLL